MNTSKLEAQLQCNPDSNYSELVHTPQVRAPSFTRLPLLQVGEGDCQVTFTSDQLATNMGVSTTSSAWITR